MKKEVAEALEKSKRGFTLIELIIVLVIIAILASIAIPQLAGSDKGAKLAKMQSDIRNASSSLQAFYMAYRDYPTQTATANDGTADNVVDGTNGAVKEYLQDPNGNDSGIAISVSEGNKLRFTRLNADGTTCRTVGYQIEVINPDLPNDCYIYNSCTDSAPRHETANCPTF